MTERTLLLLPLDVLVNIFKYLKISDYRNLMLSCKLLKDIIVNDNLLWRLKSRSELIIECKSDSFSTYHKCRISHNWCKGIFKNRVIVQHSINYMPWIQFTNSSALFLSTDTNLYCYSIDRKDICRRNILWSISMPTVQRNDFRPDDISRFIYKNNLLVCGNRDGCAAVYRLNDWKKRPKLLAHIKDCHDNGRVEVSAVETVGNLIVTASDNSPSVSFWQPNNYSNQHTYTKTDVNLPDIIGCRCVGTNMSNSVLAVGANGNCKPLLIDVNTGKLLFPASNVNNTKVLIRDLHWRDENTLVYVSHSANLALTDVRIGKTVYHTTDPFMSPLYCVKSDLDRAVIVGSAEYTRCVLYDLRKNLHVQMYFTQKKMSPVYSLDFDTTRLFAAADRGLAALNFNVCSATNQQRDYSSAFECIF